MQTFEANPDFITIRDFRIQVGGRRLLVGKIAPHAAAPDLPRLVPNFAGWNTEADLYRIVCPVPALQGRDDPYGTIGQVEGIRQAVSGPDGIDTRVRSYSASPGPGSNSL